MAKTPSKWLVSTAWVMTLAIALQALVLPVRIAGAEDLLGGTTHGKAGAAQLMLKWYDAVEAFKKRNGQGVGALGVRTLLDPKKLGQAADTFAEFASMEEDKASEDFKKKVAKDKAAALITLQNQAGYLVDMKNWLRSAAFGVAQENDLDYNAFVVELLQQYMVDVDNMGYHLDLLEEISDQVRPEIRERKKELVVDPRVMWAITGVGMGMTALSLWKGTKPIRPVLLERARATTDAIRRPSTIFTWIGSKLRRGGGEEHDILAHLPMQGQLPTRARGFFPAAKDFFTKPIKMPNSVDEAWGRASYAMWGRHLAKLKAVGARASTKFANFEQAHPRIANAGMTLAATALLAGGYYAYAAGNHYVEKIDPRELLPWIQSDLVLLLYGKTRTTVEQFNNEMGRYFDAQGNVRKLALEEAVYGDGPKFKNRLKEFSRRVERFRKEYLHYSKRGTGFQKAANANALPVAQKVETLGNRIAEWARMAASKNLDEQAMARHPLLANTSTRELAQLGLVLEERVNRRLEQLSKLVPAGAMPTRDQLEISLANVEGLNLELNAGAGNGLNGLQIRVTKLEAAVKALEGKKR